MIGGVFTSYCVGVKFLESSTLGKNFWEASRVNLVYVFRSGFKNMLSFCLIPIIEVSSSRNFQTSDQTDYELGNYSLFIETELFDSESLSFCGFSCGAKVF